MNIALAAKPHSTLTAVAPVLCGEPNCRVCKVLRYLAGGPRPSRYNHHPLNTPRARERLDQIHAALLAFQAEHARSAALREIGPLVGLSANTGLTSLYLQRLEKQGRARRVPTGEMGRGPWRWEAV